MCALAVTTQLQAHEAVDPELLSGGLPDEFIQVWLGTTDADEAWSLDDSDGNELVGDYDNLPLGGGVGQRLWGDRGQYGYEGGGLVSWRNEDVDYAGSSPGLVIAIKGDLFLVDVFMGGVIAVKPTRWLRLYAAAGPSIAFGYLSGDDDDEDEDEDGDGNTIIISGPNSFVVIDGDDNSSDFSFSAYARAGIEFEFNNGVTLGASVRYTDHEFDFDSRGELQLDEVQWFLTIGGRI